MAVLCLTYEIGCDHFWIGTGVGDNGDFGRSGKNVDADFAKQHSFGLGNEFIARSDDDIGRLSSKQTERHGGDRLNTAQRHDDICPSGLHCIEDVGMYAATLIGCGAGNNRLNTRGFRGRNRHISRGDVRVSAGRYITSGDIDRDQPLSNLQSRQQFDRKIVDALALRFAQSGALD